MDELTAYKAKLRSLEEPSVETAFVHALLAETDAEQLTTEDLKGFTRRLEEWGEAERVEREGETHWRLTPRGVRHFTELAEDD